VNAIGIVTLSILLVLVMCAPARWAMLAIVAGALYMTLGQVIAVAGISVYPMRILTLAASVRLIVRREYLCITLNKVDAALLLVFVYRTIVFLLNGNGSAVTALGLLIDTGLSYFACRGLVRSVEDLVWLLRALALLLVPYVLLLYLEYSSSFGAFAAIGGETVHSYRNGMPRCTGSFSHATILGTFGASFMPLFIALSLQKDNRVYGVGGFLLCLGIVFFSNSGGPLMCAALAVAGWLLWGMRRRMHIVRRALLVAGIFVALAMKAPIWYLPAKISSLTGGDGWHRSYLMEVAFHAFDQWWLAGMPLVETRSWFPYTVVTGGADLINYYLDFGIAAGVVAIGLFCFMLVRAYRAVGDAFDQLRANSTGPTLPEMLLWAMGVILTMHIFNWFALVYFDQFHTIFLLQLALLSTVSGLYCGSVQKSAQQMDAVRNYSTL
jgi:hypothetical protein